MQITDEYIHLETEDLVPLINRYLRRLVRESTDPPERKILRRVVRQISKGDYKVNGNGIMIGITGGKK